MPVNSDTYPVQERPLVLLSNRPWNSSLAERLSQRLNRHVTRITKPSELRPEVIATKDPQWVFVTHWNNWIPKSIWGTWPTVIFHMTDLPYGRGGSPLQNLIKRKHRATKITAILCDNGLDTGDIYLKEDLSLEGSAEEIFLRADKIIEHMIEEIVRTEPVPIPQVGTPELFKRRTPSQSNIDTCPAGDVDAWYDHIRMLDATGYPHAFLEANGMRLELRRVSQRSDGLYADVKIVPLSQGQTDHHNTDS